MKQTQTQTALLCLLLAVSFAFGQEPPSENDYYKISEVPIPKDVYLEVGALEILDGKLYASSRRGDIYAIEDALGDKLPQAKFVKFAGGLHEVLGLSACLLYTSPSPRDATLSRMPSSA